MEVLDVFPSSFPTHLSSSGSMSLIAKSLQVFFARLDQIQCVSGTSELTGYRLCYMAFTQTCNTEERTEKRLALLAYVTNPSRSLQD